MRRTILILTAAVLMVVLMATTVSPAFAYQHSEKKHPTADKDAYGYQNGWKHEGVDQYGDPLYTYTAIGYGKLYPKYGYQCGKDPDNC